MEEKDLQDTRDASETSQNVENQSNTAAETIDEQGDELQRLQQQLDEQKDKYLRLVADFDNFRKRTAKERLELIQTAGKDVIISLLPVLDDSERAEKQLQVTDDVKALKEGVNLVFGKLRSSLQAKGVKAMESIGTGGR